MAGGPNVRVRWNEAEWGRILNRDELPAALEKAAGRTRDRAKDIITGAGRVDTGAMRNSIVALRVFSAGSLYYEVSSNLPALPGQSASYATFQHEGVQGPVYPRRALVLRFKPKGSSTFVFAPSTRGFSGVPFLTDALKMLRPGDFD